MWVRVVFGSSPKGTRRAASAAAAQQEIDALRADVAERDAEIDTLKARLDAIEATLKHMPNDAR